jgi:hypothetical protein
MEIPSRGGVPNGGVGFPNIGKSWPQKARETTKIPRIGTGAVMNFEREV